VSRFYFANEAARKKNRHVATEARKRLDGKYNKRGIAGRKREPSAKLTRISLTLPETESENTDD